MIENWKQVVGYAGFYDVSDHGRVRSLARSVRAGFGSTRISPGRILRQTPGSGGYMVVGLSKNGVVAYCLVHALVLGAFRGRRPDGYDSCHNNNDRTDNRIDNLRWDTRRENMRDKIKHGTHQSREKGPRAILNEAKVIEIRACKWERGRGKFFARKFGVSESTISLVHLGKLWA